MPQSHSNVVIHLVFGTKHRTPWLTKDFRGELHAYLAGILKNSGCTPIEIGGVEDHVHLLFAISRTLTLAQIAEKLKTSSSKWVKERAKVPFSWQGGYAAYSVGARDVEVVRAYIKGQEDHHRKASFEDEFRHLLREAGIEFDERYVWG